LYELAGPQSATQDQRRPGTLRPDASIIEPCGGGVASGTGEPAPEPERVGGVLPPAQVTEGDAEGDHGDGAQAGAVDLRDAQGRGGVCVGESGGVRAGLPGAAGAAAESPGSGVGLRVGGW